MTREDAKQRRAARIHTPTAFGPEATRDIAGALKSCLRISSPCTSRRRTSTGTSRARIFATTICCSTSRRTRSLPLRTPSPNGYGKSEAPPCIP